MLASKCVYIYVIECMRVTATEKIISKRGNKIKAAKEYSNVGLLLAVTTLIEQLFARM